MTVVIECPKCGKTYQSSEQSLGRKVRCKQCGAAFAARTSNETDRASPGVGIDTQPSHQSSANSGLLPRVGRFQIRSKLGSGSFGTVYRAYDPVLEREVALKVPNPGLLSDEQDKQRYLREPKAAAQLHHPHIVPVFEASLDGESIFIASAFIEGHTLEKALEAGRPDFRRTASLVMKLASALQYAHEHGIVHRDVKPTNIMLDTKGEPLLMDFGLARIQESVEKLTHDNVILGTPAYMSPEQAAGKQAEVGPASDQYSLGVVLYEMLCGQRPFSGPPALIIALLINNEPSSPRANNPQVPRDLETICLKAMAKKPDQRYSSSDEFGADLRRWQAGQTVLARPVSVAEKFARWARREPIIAGLIATVALVLVTSLAIVSLQWRTERSLRIAAAQAESRTATEAEKVKQGQKELSQEVENVKAEKRRAEQRRYYAEMMAAQQIWESTRDADHVRKVIDQYVPTNGTEDRRGFEWYHLSALCPVPDAIIELEPNTSVAYMNFLPEKRQLAIGTGAPHQWKTVEVWQLGPVFKRLSSFKVPAELVESKQVIVSPHREWAVFATNKDVVQCLDLATGDKLGEWSAGKYRKVSQIAFSPSADAVSVLVPPDFFDGRLHESRIETLACPQLISRSSVIPADKELRFDFHRVSISADFKELAILGRGDESRGREISLWNMETGVEIRRAKSDARRVEFSPDGSELLLWRPDNRVEVRNHASLEPTRDFRESSRDWIAVSSDGKWLAMYDRGDHSENQVRIWDFKSSELELLLRAGTDVRTIAFADEGKSLYMASSNVIKRLPIDSARRVLTAHRNAATGAVFSSDGKYLATREKGRKVCLWNTRTWSLEAIWDEGSWPESFYFDERGESLVKLDRGTFSVWEIANRKTVLTQEDQPMAAPSRNSDTLIAKQPSGALRAWKLAGSQVDDISDQFSILAQIKSRIAVGFALSPDARHVAIAHEYGSGLKLVDLQKSAILSISSGIHSYIDAIVFTNDGKRLICSSHDATEESTAIIALDEPDKPCRFVNCYFTSHCYALSLNGRYLAIRRTLNPHQHLEKPPSETIIECWDLESGSQISILEGHLAKVLSICFSPDGERLASSGEDGTIRLWDWRQGVESMALMGHRGPVHAVQFAPDGNVLVSCGDDTTVRIWMAPRD